MREGRWVFRQMEVIDQDGIVACLRIFGFSLYVVGGLPIISRVSFGRIDTAARLAGLLRRSIITLFRSILVENEGPTVETTGKTGFSDFN